jgi:hypothetical protein
LPGLRRAEAYNNGHFLKWLRPRRRVKPGNDGIGYFSVERADIGNVSVYINPARHVRAFGVGLDWKNDGYDEIERRAG